MNKTFYRQFVPLLATFVTFVFLAVLLFLYLKLLDTLPVESKIALYIRPQDVLVGFTIYIKTAIDFALFMGNLMYVHPGWKNRIAIDLGTNFGNAVGTIIILTIWTFFKEIPLLLIAMILIAALVLLKMAEEGIGDLLSQRSVFPPVIQNAFIFLKKILGIINKPLNPVIGRIIPKMSMDSTKNKTFIAVLLFSFTVPFVLGLDDFAGYIPLFSIINIFGFAIGTLLGHMLLNISLFAFPALTTRVVRHPFIIGFGSLVFLGLSLLGFFEVIKGLVNL